MVGVVVHKVVGASNQRHPKHIGKLLTMNRTKPESSVGQKKRFCYKPDPPRPMLRVVAGLSGVFEDVQVGGSLAVRLKVGRSYKRSNHSRVAEDLQ